MLRPRPLVRLRSVARIGSAAELTYLDRVLQDGVPIGAVTTAVSPDGDFVYVAGGVNGSIGVFARDHATGGLTFRSAVEDGVDGVDGVSGVLAIVLSDDGQYLYAASGGDNALAVFARDADTGALTEIQSFSDGQEIDGLAGARQIAISPDGTSLYVAALYDFAVTAFDRDTGTGLLTFVVTRHYELGVTPDLGNTDGLAVAPTAARCTSGASRS